MLDSQAIARTLEILDLVNVTGKEAPSLAGAIAILKSVHSQIVAAEDEIVIDAVEKANQEEAPNGKVSKKARK